MSFTTAVRLAQWPVLATLLFSSLVIGRSAMAQPIDASWLNAASGNWNDSANWDTADFPNNGGADTYNAIIDATGTAYTVTLSSQTVTIDSLLLDSSDALLTINGGGEISLLGTATLSAGQLRLNGGMVTGGMIDATSVSLEVTNNFNSRLNGVAVMGDLNLSDPGDAIRLENGANYTGNATLGQSAQLGVANSTIGGTADLATNAALGTTGNSTLTLDPTAMINLNGPNASIAADRFVSGAGEIINQGTISGTSATGITRIQGNANDSFDNQGIVQVSGGGRLEITANLGVANLSGTTLTGGVWRSAGMSDFQFRPGTIAENAAEIILDGAGCSSALAMHSRLSR